MFLTFKLDYERICHQSNPRRRKVNELCSSELDFSDEELIRVSYTILDSTQLIRVVLLCVCVCVVLNRNMAGRASIPARNSALIAMIADEV